MREELRNRFGDTVTSNQLGKYNDIYMQRALRGELKKISRGVWCLKEPAVTTNAIFNIPVREDNSLKEIIRERFNVLTLLGEGIVTGNIRSLMVAGAPGVGKTYEIEHRLKAAEQNKEIDSYQSIKGSISAAGLYQKLWENKEKGQVIVLDDADAVFTDEEAMNLLKGALDTSTVREISWVKQARWLEDMNIPSTFEYEGQIVFITNLDPDKVIEKGGRFAPHMSALLSRAVFLDLKIHDPQAILVRIEQVLESPVMQHSLKITDEQVDAIVKWLKDNVNTLRSLSIRTVIQLASFIKTSDNWERIADVTLNKK